MAAVIKNFYGADLVVTEQTKYVTLDEFGNVECWANKPDYLMGEWRGSERQGKAGWRPVGPEEVGLVSMPEMVRWAAFRYFIREHWCFPITSLTVEPFQELDFRVPPARLIEWYGRKVEVPQWAGYLALQPQTRMEDEKAYPLVAYELQPDWLDGHWREGRLSLTVACVIAPPMKPENSLMKLKP